MTTGNSTGNDAELREPQPAPPAHWEADVVLTDGGTVHLRPIAPTDADRLRELHSRLSPETILLRFFAAYPRLSDRDVARFTTVDHVNRVALVATLGGEFVAVGRYDRTDAPDGPGEAEVAFVVQDDHQGRGLGSVLLEHLAAVARENGITEFHAEVLPHNSRMIRVFRDAGYTTQRAFADGVVHLSFPIEPTESSARVQESREHRGEARSVQRLLHPTSVAVVGASRDRRTVGGVLFANLLAGPFEGTVFPVNPAAAHVGGVQAFASITDVPVPVDLALIAVPAAAVAEVVAECGAKGCHGVVILSEGFSETGPAGRAAERELVGIARSTGMRVIGPNCLGVANTSPAVGLNATLASGGISSGRVGFFSQSGALGIALLAEVAARGLGVSTFVSAGNRADVSGNDLLQYWRDDPDTDVVLLYLESFGNPRKFARLARSVGRSKPVVAVKTGRSTAGLPLGHPGARVQLPDEVVGALFRQAGIIRVDTVGQLFDVGQVLASQPLPAGRQTAVVTNSAALGALAADAALQAGLEIPQLSASTSAALADQLGLPPGAVDGVGQRAVVDLRAAGTAEQFRRALELVLVDPAVDAVVAVFVPPLVFDDTGVVAALTVASAASAKPVVSTLLAYQGLDGGTVPSYPTPEASVAALARAVDYAQWRAADPGRVPELEGLDRLGARAVVEAALMARGSEDPEPRDPGPFVLGDEETVGVFAAYGISVWPSVAVASAEQAAAAAEGLAGEGPLVVKAAAESLRHRADLGAVRLGVPPEQAGQAYVELTAAVGGGCPVPALVQRQAPAGVAVTVGVRLDPSFGSLVTYGVGGVATELLHDRAYHVLPLTDLDARAMVDSVRAAPLLSGYRGAPAVDVDAVADLLVRVAQLADDLPEVAALDLNPVVVSASGLAVLWACIQIAPPVSSPEAGPRRLP